MNYVLQNKNDNCAGCMLCMDICPVKAITINCGIERYEAIIDSNKCVSCNLCNKLCPQNINAELRKPVEWNQGWSINKDVRSNSSSGGLATEISRCFIKNGGEVCTCCFNDGKLGFRFFYDIESLKSATGSKYVKSNPQGIYKPLLEKLKNGKKVLLIALPCQVAAAINYAGKYADKLYTVDLICHGTPSPEILRLYLKEKGVDMSKLNDIQFRKKSSFNLYSDYKVIEKYHMDAYTYLFLNASTYTENCYSCKYARFERVSDITIGDSWGSELSEDEQKKGISLILCQTEKGKELIDMSGLTLFNVDIKKAVAANKQLNMPSEMPYKRAKFLKVLKKSNSFRKAFVVVFPKKALKDMVKKYIIKKPVGGGGYIITIDC